ncbi:KH domain-containing, RNA-binding, signal transduction-associated protein 3-like isoform X2 [Episyrphus balteatus]|uniref:KH domain-containing, RNA-binding, signal transduction-associated protein 3-like isoform X2 n=1 Tax=Episyrphus balteatus TaxID=286459 RepID=UPI002486360D|nr:KH domain-containing, RNA-binding, signal transduction-associated protein 3-like isoform X2 [Episyrphus balteatus]
MRDGTETAHVEEEGHPPRMNDVAKKFIADCIAEKERLPEDFPIAAMLIDEAIDRVHSTGRVPGRELHADVFKQKLTKVTQKVFVPTKQFPNFNFQGKILGPKGNSLRNLQKETLCRILVKGRNSMRNAEKEEEMRQSGDPRHAHLHKDLYVEISTVATPAEAHARVAYALAEIRKYLIPDSNDEVSQNQRREMLADPELSKRARKSYADDGGAHHDQAALSILKKINLSAPKDTGMEYEEAPSRYVPQRPPMKRSLQETPPYLRRNEEGGTERGPSTRPGGSILKKVTGFGGQVYDEEEVGDEEPPYEEEESNYDREPIGNMSQRPGPKRFSQTPQSSMNRRYENPIKRTR